MALKYSIKKKFNEKQNKNIYKYSIQKQLF